MKTNCVDRCTLAGRDLTLGLGSDWIILQRYTYPRELSVILVASSLEAEYKKAEAPRLFLDLSLISISHWKAMQSRWKEMKRIMNDN